LGKFLQVVWQQQGFSPLFQKRNSMEHFFFFLGLSFILTHEMDAIRCKEWLMFPATSMLRDDTGYVVFTLAHIPLFCLMLWSLFGTGTNEGLMRGLDIFFIVHVGLHILFLKHPENRFTTPLSWGIILLTGVCGALDLYLTI
jgi:hypothetical protein